MGAHLRFGNDPGTRVPRNEGRHYQRLVSRPAPLRLGRLHLANGGVHSQARRDYGSPLESLVESTELGDSRKIG
jgi:hypothetical protein